MSRPNLPTWQRNLQDWADRIKDALTETDRAIMEAPGASMVLVPLDRLITLEVAAAFAADHAEDVHRVPYHATERVFCVYVRCLETPLEGEATCPAHTYRRRS